jgi:hypothetical protein
MITLPPFVPTSPPRMGGERVLFDRKPARGAT